MSRRPGGQGPRAASLSATEKTDWRPAALALAAWAGAGVGTSAGPLWCGLSLGVALAVTILAGLRRWRLAVAVAAIGAAGVAAGWLQVAAVASGPLPRLAQEKAVVTLVGRVGEFRTVRGGPGPDLQLATLAVERFAARGEASRLNATLTLTATGDLGSRWAAIPPGTTVAALVRLSESTDPSLAAWASARGEPATLSPPGVVDAGVNAVRQGLRQAVSTLPAEPRALVPALVVGDTSAMTPQLGEQFRVTGLTHLTAVSGANLTLLLAAVLWLAGRLGVLGWWRRGVALVVVAGFVVLCRAEPSVLRAAAMGLVGLAALGWSGTRQGVRFLSWAVVGLVVVDPWLARSIGFALSVLASAGIVIWARRWADLLGSWMPHWAAEALTVPVAAQLATQPVVTAISGQVSVVGLVANLVAAPLVGPGTVLGFAAAWCSVVFSPLAAVLGWAAGGFAQTLCWIAAAGSALPGASVSWPVSPLSIALLVAVCIAMLWLLPHLWVRPWLVAVVTVAVVVACLRPLSPPGWPPQNWRVVVCDVGQGDATVLWAGAGSAVVVDSGPEPRAVDRCLGQLGVRHISWLVFTHPHADHIGGVAGVINGRQVDRVLLPAVNQAAAGWRQVRDAIGGVQVSEAAAGTTVSAGEVTLTVLALRAFVAPEVLAPESSEENDSSTVIRAQSGPVRVLLAGDVQEAGQSAAVATVADLRADVLLVPHHGSAHQDPAFWAAVAPRIALISVGIHNDYGHPAAATLAGLARLGLPVSRTDRSGSLAVSATGSGLIATEQRPP